MLAVSKMGIEKDDEDEEKKTHFWNILVSRRTTKEPHKNQISVIRIEFLDLCLSLCVCILVFLREYLLVSIHIKAIVEQEPD